MLNPYALPLLIIIALGVMLGMVKRKNSDKAFHTVVVLLVVTFITELIANSIHNFGFKTNVTVYKIFDPLQVILFSYIFYHLYQFRKLKIFAVYACIVALILLTISTIINISPNVNNSIGVTTKCALYILLSLIKFSEMLQTPSEENIVVNPTFWFCSAVFFFFSVNIMFWITFNQISESAAKNTARLIHVYCNYIFYSIVALSFLLIPSKNKLPDTYE
jgi:hypothetical protein